MDPNEVIRTITTGLVDEELKELEAEYEDLFNTNTLLYARVKCVEEIIKAGEQSRIKSTATKHADLNSSEKVFDSLKKIQLSSVPAAFEAKEGMKSSKKLDFYLTYQERKKEFEKIFKFYTKLMSSEVERSKYEEYEQIQSSVSELEQKLLKVIEQGKAKKKIVDEMSANLKDTLDKKQKKLEALNNALTDSQNFIEGPDETKLGEKLKEMKIIYRKQRHILKELDDDDDSSIYGSVNTATPDTAFEKITIGSIFKNPNDFPALRTLFTPSPSETSSAFLKPRLVNSGPTSFTQTKATLVASGSAPSISKVGKIRRRLNAHNAARQLKFSASKAVPKTNVMSPTVLPSPKVITPKSGKPSAKNARNGGPPEISLNPIEVSQSVDEPQGIPEIADSRLVDQISIEPQNLDLELMSTEVESDCDEEGECIEDDDKQMESVPEDEDIHSEGGKLQENTASETGDVSMEQEEFEEPMPSAETSKMSKVKIDKGKSVQFAKSSSDISSASEDINDMFADSNSSFDGFENHQGSIDLSGDESYVFGAKAGDDNNEDENSFFGQSAPSGANKKAGDNNSSLF